MPPIASGSGRDACAGRVGEAQHVGLVLRRERGARRTVMRAPRRTITHGAPASVPRSCSSSAVRSAVVKPNAWANASARVEVGLLELQPGDVGDLDHRIARPPGVLALAGALLAVQVIVGADDVAHPDLLILTDEIVTYDATLSQEILTKSSKLMDSATVGW